MNLSSIAFAFACASACFAVPAVANAQAANDGRIVSDIVLVASNGATPPAGPTGYTLAGYWDIDDRLGSQGTNGGAGHYMMALYVRREFPSQTSGCVNDVMLYQSANSVLPEFGGSTGWISRGRWDVDTTGGYGTFASLGVYGGTGMMGLYARYGSASGTQCATDLVFVASGQNNEIVPLDFVRVGSWDVDQGGAFGAQNSSGNWRATLSMKRVVRTY